MVKYHLSGRGVSKTSRLVAMLRRLFRFRPASLARHILDSAGSCCVRAPFPKIRHALASPRCSHLADSACRAGSTCGELTAGTRSPPGQTACLPLLLAGRWTHSPRIIRKPDAARCGQTARHFRRLRNRNRVVRERFCSGSKSQIR